MSTWSATCYSGHRLIQRPTGSGCAPWGGFLPQAPQGSEANHLPQLLSEKVALWPLGNGILSDEGCPAAKSPESFASILEREGHLCL